MSVPKGVVIPVAAGTAAGLALAKCLQSLGSQAGGASEPLGKTIPVKDLPPEVAAALRQAAKDFAGKHEPADGCSAAVSIAYAFADTIFIYPITPTTPLAETAYQWAVAGKENGSDVIPKVQQMQSEAGKGLQASRDGGGNRVSVSRLSMLPV